jgi:GNAT superfamily N-acetyltransferase
MSLMIREALPEDLPSILSLYSEIDLSGEEPLPTEKAQDRFSRIQSYPDYHIYVAVHEGHIIGTFALLIMDNLAHHGAPSGVVEGVVVRKDWQRKGIGKQLMNHAMRKCIEAKCYKVMLSSNAVREGAHKFYESLGFRRHGYSFGVQLKEE